MRHYKSFNNCRQNLKYKSSNKQRHLILQEVTSAFDCSNIVNIKKILERITTSQNVEIQIKLFSVLSAFLVNDESCREAIILNNQIYAKVEHILATNMQQKASSMLFNFLTALIYTENAVPLKKKTLIIHAQNMIRTSGCLLYMANMFSKGIMFQDTWISLCQCLTETCSNSQVNQSFCTHLVPVCIMKCFQRRPEVFSLLESLLRNHDRNIKLFLDSDGIYLFSKEYLLESTCLQLLNTVIVNPTSAMFIVKKSNVVNTLRDLLDLHGPNTQVGQWAVVILHHAAPYLPGLEEKQDVTQKLTKFPFEKVNTTIIDDNNIHVVDESESDDTATIYRNILQEIDQCGSKNSLPQREFKQMTEVFDRLIHQNQIPSHSKIEDKKFIDKQLGKTDNKKNIESQIKGHNQSTKSSFLDITKLTPNPTRKLNDVKLYAKDEYKDVKQSDQGNISTYSAGVFNTIHDVRVHEPVNDYTVHSENFWPTCSSTPKNSNVSKNSSKHRRSRLFYQSREAMRKRMSTTNKKIPIRKKKSEITQKSITSRLFNVINDSCANMFNTIKNVFKPKDNNFESNGTNMTCEGKADYSFNFANYMHEREEYFRQKSFAMPIAENTIYSYRNDTCTTCNDTISLKHKLKHNEILKQTVKKLKIGINIYGCDFKKISKAFWPTEAYMTPAILYNLYRKLILK